MNMVLSRKRIDSKVNIQQPLFFWLLAFNALKGLAYDEPGDYKYDVYTRYSEHCQSAIFGFDVNEQRSYLLLDGRGSTCNDNPSQCAKNFNKYGCEDTDKGVCCTSAFNFSGYASQYSLPVQKEMEFPYYVHTQKSALSCGSGRSVKKPYRLKDNDGSKKKHCHRDKKRCAEVFSQYAECEKKGSAICCADKFFFGGKAYYNSATGGVILYRDDGKVYRYLTGSEHLYYQPSDLLPANSSSQKNASAVLWLSLVSTMLFNASK